MAEPSLRPVVVVAEDDQSARAFFRTALERAGFVVLAAANGRRALELVRNDAVQVLLLDLSMPGMGGIETLEAIRSDPALRSLPVIIATGSEVEAERLPAWTTAPMTSSSNPSRLPSWLPGSGRTFAGTP